MVRQLVYPYSETHPLDDIMSYLTGTAIQWGTDPRITSHLYTILIKRRANLYALMTDAPLSFPTLFIRSLVEVHRSSSTAHGLFFLVFIHRILLHLGLEDFLASKPVHIITPIGATFLR